MNVKKILSIIIAALMILATVPAMAAEEQQPEAVSQQVLADAQKLDTCYTLALNAINAEDYATAREYLNVCFVYCNPQTDPKMYADLLLKMACIDVIEEQYDMALLLLEAALRIQPDLADAYLVRTQVYTSQGAMDAAVVNLEKYISLTNDASLYETVAVLQEARGDMIAAQDAYDKFAAAAGEDNKDVHFNAALYRMQNGKYADAIEAFQAFAEDEIYGAGAWYNIGVCKMNLGDYAGAAEAFTTCEQKAGTFDGLYYNRAICYLLSEDWAKSAEDFTKSIEKESYGLDARYNLGICSMQQEDYEKAVEIFDELIAQAEKDGTVLNDAVYYFRAVCNAAIGKLEEAIADLTLCIEHGYELEQTYYERAQVYAAMGDTENQTKDLQNSLKQAK